MWSRLNQAMLDWFEAHNISFHNRFGIRLRPGDGVQLHPAAEVEPYIGIHGGHTICTMGFMSYTNANVPEDLVVGRYCSLAAGLSFPRYRHPVEHVSTSIFTHDRPTDLVVRVLRDQKPGYGNFFPNRQKGGVVIGHDVWVGQGAAIMAGVTIGTGAVIAAHSVVTRSVAPYAIVGGNPARLLRMRFDAATVERLLQSEWWRYSFAEFDGLDLGDPGEFLSGFAAIQPRLQPYAPPRHRLAEVLALGN